MGSRSVLLCILLAAVLSGSLVAWLAGRAESGLPGDSRGSLGGDASALASDGRVFDSEIWKNESCGGEGGSARSLMVGGLIESGLLIGLDDEGVRALLGDPVEIRMGSPYTFVYCVRRGHAAFSLDFDRLQVIFGGDGLVLRVNLVEVY